MLHVKTFQFFFILRGSSFNNIHHLWLFVVFIFATAVWVPTSISQRDQSSKTQFLSSELTRIPFKEGTDQETVSCFVTYRLLNNMTCFVLDSDLLCPPPPRNASCTVSVELYLTFYHHTGCSRPTWVTRQKVTRNATLAQTVFIFLPQIFLLL